MLPYRPRAKQGTLPITQEFRHVTDTGIFCRITGGAEADTFCSGSLSGDRKFSPENLIFLAEKVLTNRFCYDIIQSVAARSNYPE